MSPENVLIRCGPATPVIFTSLDATRMIQIRQAEVRIHCVHLGIKRDSTGESKLMEQHIFYVSQEDRAKIERAVGVTQMCGHWRIQEDYVGKTFKFVAEPGYMSSFAFVVDDSVLSNHEPRKITMKFMDNNLYIPMVPHVRDHLMMYMPSGPASIVNDYWLDTYELAKNIVVETNGGSGNAAPVDHIITL